MDYKRLARRERCERRVREVHCGIERLHIDAIDSVALCVDQIVFDGQHNDRDAGVSKAQVIAPGALRELRRLGGDIELLCLQSRGVHEISIADQSDRAGDADDVEVEHQT